MSNYNPANTFPILSYANTFSDWMVATNDLLQQNNDLAANNFYKGTGTMYLQDPTLGLQVSNNAIIGGQLQSSGIGSGASIQNNLTVGGQVYLNNTTTSLFVAGAANVAGEMYLNGANNGLYVANNAYVGGSALIQNNITSNTLHTNTVITTTSAYASSNVVGNYVYANTQFAISNTSFLINSYEAILPATIASSLQVSGTFAIAGATIYTSNNFTLAQNVIANQNAYLNVYRPTGNTASIRWNDQNAYWDIADVNNLGSYSKILTANLISDSITLASSSSLASSNAVNNLSGVLNAAVTTAYSRANTSSNTFVGTVGSASASNGSISFASNNGVTVTGSANTLTVNTPQDLRTSASPSFTGGSFSLPVTGVTLPNNTSNTSFATTAYVQNSLNSGTSFTHNISGSATNATYASSAGSSTNASYASSAGSSTNAGYAGAAGYASGAGSATNASYAGYAGNSGTVGGLAVSSGVNNGANQVVRTDGSGYIQAGYIQSLSGGGEHNASNPGYIWGTNGSDSYLRTYNPAYVQVGYASSASYSSYAGGAGYASNAGGAGSATNASYASSAGSATNASYAGGAGYASSAGYASIAGYASNAPWGGISGVPSFLYVQKTGSFVGTINNSAGATSQTCTLYTPGTGFPVVSVDFDYWTTWGQSSEGWGMSITRGDNGTNYVNLNMSYSYGAGPHVMYAYLWDI